MTPPRIWVLRALLVAPLVPLATGHRMVTYQDAIMTHLPAKAATVEQMRAGLFPFLNPYASFGQPLAGNPNFGTFFPDMLAFLMLPLPMAFGLRFALAAVLAYAGARRWARAEGATRGAAEVAAIAFALSGVYVSTWRFFNSGLALALAPWVIAAAARLGARAGDAPPRRRRAVAGLALASGLEVLAGEPVIALMSFGLAGLRVLMGPERRRGLVGAALALALGGAIAAPQIVSTAQVYATSTRSLAPFPYLLASSTSLTPARLLEQAAPFPFGRPDRTGEAGFTGHEHYDNHPPYLWTLHLGWVVIAVLLIASRPRDRAERWWWLLLAAAVLLSFGRGLPGAKWIHPMVSLGGRMRFPVKWWYVVALVLVPLVAMAVSRWEVRPTFAARGRAALVAAVGLAVLILVVRGPGLSGVAGWAAAVSVLSVVVLIVRPPPTEGLAWMVALTLALSNVPLWRTLVDVVPDPSPRFAGGRVYQRAAGEAHPRPHAPDWPPVEPTTREIFRRAPRELWALTGALGGMPYAFDGDPNIFEGDRVVGKSVDALPWGERAPFLRASGVGYVVAGEELPPPFARIAVLSPEHGVAIHRLEGAAPSVRVATRLFTAVTFDDVVPRMSRPEFDPQTDAVVLASAPTGGTPLPSSSEVVEEMSSRLRVRVVAAAPALVVWSRTFFQAWRARVDGREAEVVVADGHLVGVPVPAGAHEVEVSWSRAPVVAGALVSVVALGLVVLLRRR